MGSFYSKISALNFNKTTNNNPEILQDNKNFKIEIQLYGLDLPVDKVHKLADYLWRTQPVSIDVITYTISLTYNPLLITPRLHSNVVSEIISQITMLATTYIIRDLQCTVDILFCRLYEI